MENDLANQVVISDWMERLREAVRKDTARQIELHIEAPPRTACRISQDDTDSETNRGVVVIQLTDGYRY